MNWLYYLLEANLYLGVFYLAYYLFLSRETWYTLNRIYLLLSCVMSFILPVVQLGVLKPTVQYVAAVNYMQAGQQITLSPVKDVPVAYQFTWQDGIFYAYVLGAVIVLAQLLIKLYQLAKLAQSTKKQTDNAYKLVYLNDTNTAFSFFNWLFIGTKAGGEETIIRHELVHIRQKHSVDIIFVELLKIVNWFNPFIYLLQISLRAVHEYIADEKTATAENDALAYSTFLVSNAYGLSGPTVTHSFFNYNLLKKRIIMLHQKRSGSLASLKYLMALPLCAALVCASTLAFSKNYALVDLFPQQRDTDHLAPPPPPAPPVAAMDRHLPPPPPPPAAPGRMVVFPAPKNPKETTTKGFKYAEGGEMVNGKVYLNVTIYDKDGTHKQYFKGSATPAELKLLKDKYGYTFPAKPNFSHFTPPPPPVPPVDAKDNKIPPIPVVMLDHNAPPPPVPPVDAKRAKKFAAGKYPPPVVMPYHNAPAPPLPTLHLIAPPPPFDPAFAPLYDHLSKMLYYPADAKAKNVYGVVEASFSLDANNKITNVGILKSLGLSCDIVVMKALSSYAGTISKNDQQYYTVSVSFDLIDGADKMNLKDFDPKVLGSPSYALAIPVVADVKAN